MTDQFSNESMLELFVFETTQLMEQLEEIILTNEKASLYPEDAIHEIFRIMHTIKGSSSIMMFQNMSSLAHAMEDLFYYIRDEKPKNFEYSVLADLIFACIDFLKIEIEKVKSGNTPDGEYSYLLSKIKEFLNSLKLEQLLPTAIQKTKSNKYQQIDMYLDENCSLISMNYYKAVIYFEDGIAMENIHAYSIIHNLKKSQDEVFYIPKDIAENSDSAEVIQKEGFKVFIKTVCPYDVIYQLLVHTVFLKELELTQLDNDEEFKERFGKQKEPTEQETIFHLSDQEQEGNTPVVKETQMATSQQSIISVNVTKLDKLMDLVGEIVIAEAMVIQNSDLNGLVLDNFKKAARNLNKITEEIQDTVMAIRMVPLATTFHKMHRLVRDMCKKLGKEVKLEIIGEETEVDKNIIEHISDPLMHLVRNAIDHGMEISEERIQKGKPPIGTITLEAKSSGSEVLVHIKDDGRGLSKEGILKRAREHNLLTRPEEAMQDKDIFDLILLPGFSTKDTVTEFSGRGVGMDVVTKNLEMVGGSVSINSKQDQGTNITLKIPLTLAIIDGMNIKVGNSNYTIPTTSVKEFFRPEIRNIITDPDGSEMIMVRGQCYSLLKLYELFEVKDAKKEIDCGIIIMVELDDKMLCIFADELLGQQQVVVKALPEYIRRTKKVKGLIGCTLLGNGSISLILDVAGLIT